MRMETDHYQTEHGQAVEAAHEVPGSQLTLITESDHGTRHRDDHTINVVTLYEFLLRQ